MKYKSHVNENNRAIKINHFKAIFEMISSAFDIEWFLACTVGDRNRMKN